MNNAVHAVSITANDPGKEEEDEDADFGDQLASLRSNLRARALFLAQDAAAAEDLVQDVLERALLSRARFQEGTHLKAWLHSILRNLFIDGRRRLATRLRLDREVELGVAADDQPSGPADVLSSADVAEALARLDEPQREVFRLACVDGLSYQEVAARLGIPASTVGTRLLRTKRRLRLLLSPVYERRLMEIETRVRWLPCSVAVV